jgi:hypothetical protein
VSAGDAAKTTALPEAPRIAATAAEIFGFGFIALLPEGQVVVNFPLETLEPVNAPRQFYTSERQSA